MAYKHVTISSFLRALLGTSVIGVTYLPVALFFCDAYSPTVPAAPSLRLLIPSGFLIGCHLIQVYKHHSDFPVGVGKTTYSMASTLTFPALSLCAVSSFI
jgi:hypothetical protein